MIGSNSSSVFQLFAFSGIAITLFALSLLLGLFLYNVKLNNQIKTYFLNSLLGLFTFISLYSFYLVGIKTINLLAFIVLIYLFIKNKSKFKIGKIDSTSLLPVLYIFPVVFILYGSYSLPTSVENDLRYYAKIAYALGKFKQENLYHFYNAYQPGFNGLMPYHYTEMWVTSLFNMLFNIKSIIAIKYITYPFLISCISFGFLGFVNKKRFLYFIFFIALSLLPFHLVSIFGSGFTVYTDFWLRPNFIMYYLMLLPLFYFIMEKKWELFFLMSIIASTTSVLLIPCLFGGLFLLAVFLVYQKQVSKKEFIQLNSLLLISVIIMAVLFMVFSPAFNLLASQSFAHILMESLSVWKAIIYSIVTISIECGFLVFIAFMLNKFLIKEATLNLIFIFVALQISVGVVLFQLLNQLDNSYQFPYVAFSAAGLVLIMTIILALDNLKNRYLKHALSLVLIAVSVYASTDLFDFKNPSDSLETKNLLKNNISHEWIKNVKAYLDNNEEAKGGFVLSKKDLNNMPPKSRNCITYQMGSFLSYLTDNCNLPDLTCKDTLLSDKNNSNVKSFAKTESWMKAFPNYTAICDVNDYLKNDTFDYFICSKNMTNIDPTFIIITDKESDYILVYKK